LASKSNAIEQELAEFGRKNGEGVAGVAQAQQDVRGTQQRGNSAFAVAMRGATP
jgi:hypothetical protein